MFQAEEKAVKSLRCLLASWGRERNRRPVWLELSDSESKN